MRKLWLFLAISFLISFCGVPRSYSENGADVVYEYETLRAYATIESKSLVGVLRDARDVSFKTPILAFEVSFSKSPGYRKEDKEIVVERIPIELKDVKGMAVDDWRNIKLVLDKNKNYKFDSEDEVLDSACVLEPIDVLTEIDKGGRPMLKSGIIISKPHLVVPLEDSSQSDKSPQILVTADLYDLKEGDSFAISLTKEGVEYKIPSASTDVSLVFSVETKHHVGNQPPILAFLPERPFGSEIGAHSRWGYLDRTEFEFAVQYTDLDNDFPTEKFLEIDEDGDGKYERYEMRRKDEGGADWWDIGVNFVVKVPLEFINKPTKFRFSFSDRQKEALGKPAEEQSIMVRPWVFVPPELISLHPPKCLPGQKIRLEAGLIRHLDAKVDLFSLVEKSKEFSKVKVEEIILGQREVFPGTQEFEVQYFTVLLSPKATEFGEQEITSLKFPFSVESFKGEQFLLEKEIQIPAFKFELAPIIAEARISKDEAVLGDSIDYILDFLIYPGTELTTDISRLTLNPFRKLKKKNGLRIEEILRDNLLIKTYTFRTWIYELPPVPEQGKESSYAFPALNIKAEYQGKEYAVQIPEKKVRFIPALSPEELAKQMSIAVPAVRFPEQTDYFDFFIAPLVVAGILLLFCLVVLLFFFLHLGKRAEVRKRKEDFAYSYGELLNGLEDWDISRAEELLVKIQIFFEFLYPQEKGVSLRARDVPFLVNLIGEDNLVFTKTREKVCWEALLENLSSLIYGEKISEGLIAASKTTVRGVADALKSNEKRLKKLIR